jgi:hypothetical protein
MITVERFDTAIPTRTATRPPRVRKKPTVKGDRSAAQWIALEPAAGGGGVAAASSGAAGRSGMDSL